MVEDKKSYKTTATVWNIRGSCPIYKVGDKIIFDSEEGAQPYINATESDNVCMRALMSMTFLAWYTHGNDDDVTYMFGGTNWTACPLPGEPYTPCGRAIFEFSREEA